MQPQMRDTAAATHLSAALLLVADAVEDDADVTLCRCGWSVAASMPSNSAFTS
jgi:CDGSH-type Zn-finger protein